MRWHNLRFVSGLWVEGSDQGFVWGCLGLCFRRGLSLGFSAGVMVGLVCTCVVLLGFCVALAPG